MKKNQVLSILFLNRSLNPFSSSRAYLQADKGDFYLFSGLPQ